MTYQTDHIRGLGAPEQLMIDNDRKDNLLQILCIISYSIVDRLSQSGYQETDLTSVGNQATSGNITYKLATLVRQTYCIHTTDDVGFNTAAVMVFSVNVLFKPHTELKYIMMSFPNLYEWR